MKTKLFVDDQRNFPDKVYNYTCVRSYKECVLLLSVLDDIELVNLDYDFGEKQTGLDVLVYMHKNNIQPKEIVIHSTHREGVKKMESYIKEYFSDSQYSHCPM